MTRPSGTGRTFTGGEKVVCGTGNDTVQDTAEDTFVGCEIFN